MSDYGYDDPPRRHRSSRTRDREPEYVTETTYIQRGPGQPSRDLVFRGREDSVEDIERDFPPPSSRRGGYRDDNGPRRTRSVGGRRQDYDDDYDDFAPAAAGAAAGYAAAKAARRGSRYDDGYYSDDYDRPPRRERRKSKIQETLDGFGLGGIAGALTGRSRSRSRGRGDRNDRYDSDSDRSTRSRRGGRGGGENKKKWQQAATAALIAGATEAYRARKDPNKGTRIATAALASAGLDSFLDREPGHHSKRHVLESVVGGLAANRLANGPTDRSQSRGRSESRSPSRGGGFRSRSRSILRSLSRGGGSRRGASRSRSRGRGLKEVAALGGVAAVGKAIYDRVRSKSRGRNKSRSRSRSRSDSEDSYVPSRRQQYRGGQGRSRGGDDDYQGSADRGAPDDTRGDVNSTDDPQRGRAIEHSIEDRKQRDGSSSSVSTTDLENQRKRSRGKELLTAGLATVATIHAAHGVYSSMKASEERHKAVAAGEMSKEKARKQKSKNMLQDAAAVGIAALGIKGAFSEWKEMNEQRHEVKEIEEKHRKKRKKREQRQREERERARQQRALYGPMGYAPYGYPAVAAPPMPVYADANPYAVGNLPPPPMGGGGAGSPRY